MTSNRRWSSYAGLLGLLIMLTAGTAQGRDAAFLDPSQAGGTNAADGAVKVEPKADIEAGDTILNVPRRISLFFVNQASTPVQVEKVAANGDGNVTTEITNDDCTKQATLASGSRCSVEVSVTPNTPGAWSAEVILTHNGAGRIARARMSGKTSGTVTGEKKDTGLALSSKDIKPIDFGEVDVGDGKIVRSALMINDSTEMITLYAIDVIEADNGLQRLEQGCAIDMELKPGESCPVTLVWTPTGKGLISTDLIIRHSGRLGFAVIPIRGIAKGDAELSPSASSSGKVPKADLAKASTLPLPPSANEVASSTKIPSISMEALGGAASGTLRLIGTVGNRAVVLKPDGTTAVVEAGDEFDMNGNTTRVISVSAKSMIISSADKKRTLNLQAAPELTEKARSSKASTGSAGVLGLPGAPSSTDLKASAGSATALPTGASTLPGFTGGSLAGAK